MSNVKTLKLISYLTRDLPVELFEIYRDYLEEVFNVEAFLMIDSRWNGPPDQPRSDVFASGLADIGFMCSSAFVRCQDNKSFSLLPVGAVHHHPLSQGRPVYYADVIINSSKKDVYSDFHKLKGHTWAYSKPDSISSNLAALAELKRLGTNASFFGHKIETGSHIKSIEAVLNFTADASAVHSVCLDHYCRTHPEARDKIHVLTSWGPLSTYGIVVSNRLPDEIKRKLKLAFLDMGKNTKWEARLKELGVEGFVQIDESIHQFERDVITNSKTETIDTIYY